MKNTLLLIAFALMNLALGAFISYAVYRAVLHRHCFGTLHPALVLLIALASAFTYVNYINPFKRTKPFNCVTCLTGWIALILAYCFNVPFYCFYFPLGILLGGLFERLTMRYL